MCLLRNRKISISILTLVICTPGQNQKAFVLFLLPLMNAERAVGLD